VRVWSLSPFLNELDVLEIRLGEQASVVDTFVIAEASTTHMGMLRNRVLEDQLDGRFWRWKDQIRYLRVNFPDNMARGWARENYQREQLGRGLSGLDPADIVIVCDVDEILSADTIRKLKAGEIPIPCHLSFPIHPYRLDWRWDDLEGWGRCTVVNGSHFRDDGNGFHAGAHYAVEGAERTSLVGEYGWHFTYIGDEETIVKKAAAIADEWVKGVAAYDDATRAIREGKDVFGRDYRTSSRVPLSSLPVYVQENRDRFAHILGAL
jgi:hypothetical protein